MIQDKTLRNSEAEFRVNKVAPPFKIKVIFPYSILSVGFILNPIKVRQK